MRRFKTAPDVIDALGGDTKFANWYGVSRQRVTMWRKRGFPATLFLAMSNRLRNEHQIDAHPSCWGMAEQVSA